MFNLPEIRGEYRYQYNLSQITWFKVGGNADVLFKPEDEDDLIYFLQNLDSNIPVTILGNCSNVIIRDGGVEGVVIKLGRNFAKQIIDETGKIIVAGAGSLNSTVATFALNEGLSNLEFLVGIPGTIGGGIKMNAGAYGAEFKDVVDSVRAINRKGEVITFKGEEINFTYRSSNLPDDIYFISANLKVRSGVKAEIKEKMSNINEQRSSSQPIKEKTGGSTFANPLSGKKAWQLIDEAGLRGFSIGGAQFSEKHCNFMINTGEANAKELEDLGNLAIEKVKSTSGVELRWEIKRIGRNA